MTSSLATLSHLQHPSTISHGKLSDIILPSDAFDILSYIYESTQGKDDTSQSAESNCTYNIHGAESGLGHVTNILTMLVDISMESASSYDATAAFQDYLAWIFESFLTAHELQNKWQIDVTLRESCKKSEIMSFCALHALLSSLQEKLSASMLRKGYALLSIFCADLLKTPADLTDKLIQLKICSSVLNLVAVCKDHDSMRRVVLLHLVPAIQTIFQDEVACAALSNDFKVLLFDFSFKYIINKW